MHWEEIDLEEIECSIKEDIEECTKKIKRFVEVINYQFESGCGLGGFVLTILRAKANVFEDDGNTKTEGYKYKAIWAYSYGRYNINSLYIQNNMQEECIYFEYENSERIRDHEVQENRFLSLYFCDHEYPGCDGLVKRIDYNNNNYELTSIINNQNAATCTLKIKEAKRRIALEKFFENVKI